jgi:hypothetical protein
MKEEPINTVYFKKQRTQHRRMETSLRNYYNRLDRSLEQGPLSQAVYDGFVRNRKANERIVQLQGKRIDLAKLIYLGLAADEDIRHYTEIKAELKTCLRNLRD